MPATHARAAQRLHYQYGVRIRHDGSASHPEKGGWGFAYSSSKAAFMRMVGCLHVEHKNSGIHFFNVEPGFIVTENMLEKGLVDDRAEMFGGAPPTVPAAVIAWLATAADAEQFQGQTISAQKHCLKYQLLPEWQPKNSSHT
nr:SDR family oxidoreductase [Oceanicoccus sp. KOV_DT_Chl]